MKPILVLLALVIGGVVFYLANNWVRCPDNGLTQNSAQAIADARLATKFKGHPLEREMKLRKSQQQPEDKSWLFMYQAGDCEIAIIVDKCGVADIGGISGGCLPPSQKAPESKVPGSK